MITQRPRFDDCLPFAVNTICEIGGNEVLLDCVIFRDTAGLIAVILTFHAISELKERLDVALRQRLQHYARSDNLVRDITDLGTDRLIREASALSEVLINGKSVRLVDRLVIGADWYLKPAPTAGGIPRLIFASLKGGVGRSTALCVVAAHLSQAGRRVLAIDLDLEAPGLGSMLLRLDERPECGVVDYLVESGIGGLDDSLLQSMLGKSSLGNLGASVTVVPAFGANTLRYPENAVTKLFRSYVETVSEDGLLTLRSKITQMVADLQNAGSYDVILLDARAGMSEIGAAPLLGLGGDVFFFATNQPQTFEDYTLLFAHFSRLPVDISDDWRDRMHFVYAKANDDEISRKKVADDLFPITLLLYPMVNAGNFDEVYEEFDFDMTWKGEAEVIDDDIIGLEGNTLIRILEDVNYRLFDPLSNPAALTSETYAKSFSEMINAASGYVAMPTEEDL